MGYSSYSSSTQKIIIKKLEEYGIEKPYAQKLRQQVTDEDVFVENSKVSQHCLRTHYSKLFPPDKCSICGNKAEWMGQPLTLLLDHINGNHFDDRIENLRWVCPNCNAQLETTGFKKMRVKNPQKENHCIDCGKKISYKATRCNKCRVIHTSKSKDKPTRERLKSLIRNKSFVEIGKIYSVSDNAVRKWCKFYDLPFLKHEINSYSDSEWAKI